MRVVLVLVLLAGSVAAVPPAAAHECESYDGCDARECVEGENHDHTDMDRVGRDERCRTYDGTPPKPCYIAGLRFHRSFCGSTQIAAEPRAGGLDER